MSQVHTIFENLLGLSLAGLLMHQARPIPIFSPVCPLIFLFGASLLKTSNKCRGKKCLGALVGFDPPVLIRRAVWLWVSPVPSWGLSFPSQKMPMPCLPLANMPLSTVCLSTCGRSGGRSLPQSETARSAEAAPEGGQPTNVDLGTLQWPQGGRQGNWQKSCPPQASFMLLPNTLQMKKERERNRVKSHL